MKKRYKSVIKKQLVKYGLIILLFVIGLFIYRIVWELSMKVVYITLGIAAGIITISLIFDWITAKDLLPIFRG